MYLLAIVSTLKEMKATQGSLDECGIRFTLRLKLFEFLCRSIKGANRPKALTSSDWAWALHSDSQDNLVSLCLGTKPTWEAIKKYGIAVWLRNPTVIRKLTEDMAKAQFMKNREPTECALFYMALNKKSILIAFFKTVRNTKLQQFFANNFNEERWKTAALKNAYHLMGQQRFELAMAFFLVAGKENLEKAVTVCLSSLKDYHLALWICRLVEGDDGPQFKAVVKNHIIPLAKQTSDNFLLSIAHWLLKEHEQSLVSLIAEKKKEVQEGLAPINKTIKNLSFSRPGDSSPLLSSASQQQADGTFLPQQLEQKKETFSTSLLRFYQFLSNHFLLRDAVMPEEHVLLLQHRSIYYLLNSGCLIHALMESKHLREQLKDSEGDDVHSFRPLQLANLALGNEIISRAVLQLLSRKLTELLVLRIKSSGESVQANQDQLDGLDDDDLVEIDHTLFSICSEFSRSMRKRITVALSNFCGVVQYPRLQCCILAIAEGWQFDQLRVYLLTLGCLLMRLPYNLFLSPPSLTFKHIPRIVTIVCDLFYLLKKCGSILKVGELEGLQQCIVFGLFVCGCVQQNYKALAYILRIVDITNDLNAISLSVIKKELETGNGKNEFRSEGSDEEELDHHHTTGKKQSNPFLGSTLPLYEVSVGKQGHRFLEVLLQLVMIKMLINNFIGRTANERTGKRTRSRTRPKTEPGMVRQRSNSLRKWRKSEIFDDIQSSVLEMLQCWLTWISESVKKNCSSGVMELLTQCAQQRRVQGTSLDSSFPISSLLCSLMQSSTPYKDNMNLSALWDFLMEQRALITALEPDLVYLKECLKRGMFTGNKSFSFTEALELFSDRDGNLVQSFCVSSNGLNIVAATSTGVKEISLMRSDSLPHDVEMCELNDAVSSFVILSDSKTARVSNKKMTYSSKGNQLGQNVVVQWVEPHPNYPFYLTGGIDGGIHLWQFSNSNSLCTFPKSNKARVSKIHFNQNGTKFGVADHSGKLSLWCFEPGAELHLPFMTVQAHTKRALDFAFLNNGSFVATAGVSKNNRGNINLWDVLMPAPKVGGFNVHEGGGHCVVYSPRHQMIISGGKKGDICVFDIRKMRQIYCKPDAHLLNVKTLSLHPRESMLVSGSTDGSMKIWELPNFQERAFWEDVHEKRTFMKPTTGFFYSTFETYGVMETRFIGNHLYSCGADGRILSRSLLVK